MASHADLRKRLESTSFPDLEAMMESYARAACDLAQSQFKRKLDFSGDSVDGLDEILVIIGESPDLDLDFEVRLWGSYLGEVLRRRYAGMWELTPYPGDQPPNGAGKSNNPIAVPAIEVRGSRVFPLLKVYRRLTMGDEEDLRSFFTLVTERLGKPAQVN
jgi:hypothetical protein